MSLTAAVSGFTVFFVSVSVIQCQHDSWKVTYSSSRVCAFKGSTVEISCTFRYPSSTTVERTFWFTKLQDKQPFDLRADPQYAGRVLYRCDVNKCTLEISDLSESDSAMYKFRVMANREGGNYTGEPGVHLTVTGFQVEISSSKPCKGHQYSWCPLKCTSKCYLSGQTSYVWYKNEKKVLENWRPYKGHFYAADSYSCALRGYEHSPSPPVCGHLDSCSRVTYPDRKICAFRGSSVEISCNYNSYRKITSKFWFSPQLSNWRYYSRPEDHQYLDRIQVIDREERGSTLRISKLSGSDAAEYRFKFRGLDFEWRSSFPGTRLTVTDSDLHVQVIWTSSGPKLICHSSCVHGGRSPFSWFKNGTKIKEETSVVYRGLVDPAYIYICAYEGFLSAPVYAPTFPSVSLNPSGDVMKGSLVTLTCDSEAKPAPKYTWYKKKRLLLRDSKLSLHSVQTSDSGEYYCTAENELGRTSRHVFLDVKYGPEAAVLSVSPSAEIVEGLAVTLTCSSDANPAATFTWFKENQTLLQGPEAMFNFTPISSEDRGVYSCKSENEYGQVVSASLFLDVEYAPTLPSVSVSPSGGVVEGSMVNLTCSSSANPEAAYTWYKESEGSAKASGQIFTITDFRAEHSGSYYCEAKNTRGRQTSASHMISTAGGRISAVKGTITAVLMFIILFTVLLWIRRKKSFMQQTQPNSGPGHDGLSAAAQSRPPAPQDPLRYASIRLLQNHADVVYSNIRLARPNRRPQQVNREEEVVYATVKTHTAGNQRTRSQEAKEESFALYSTVKPR